MTTDHYLARWELTLDGEPIVTPRSILVPVRHADEPAMLKIATVEEEHRGAALIVWWNGNGAAHVLAHEGDALLMERAQGSCSLTDWAENGRDDEATRVLCAAAANMHAQRHEPPPATLVPLLGWFRDLEPAAAKFGAIFAEAANVARQLLAEPRDVVVLHGDLHHGNVLDFGPRGWLAIDPKGLIGERGFDYANIFCNPNEELATAPGRLARQATLVAAEAGLDRYRLLQWILAYAGLSAAWSIEDDDDPGLAMAVAEIAATELQSRPYIPANPE